VRKQTYGSMTWNISSGNVICTTRDVSYLKWKDMNSKLVWAWLGLECPHHGFVM
jgi:hypothetical protein